MKSLTEMGTRLFVLAATRRQKGATIIEYVLLAALIGVLLLATFGGVKDAIKGAFDTVCTAINGAACTGG
ncbi:Flp family type IVb pilin [Hydrogenophaga sp.]|uniref:Flp family type IVb pilin n=1 Tax=Hydrogenophaga sp. TaxID=1904254 RepID=UPI0035B1A35C